MGIDIVNNGSPSRSYAPRRRRYSKRRRVSKKTYVKNASKVARKAESARISRVSRALYKYGAGAAEQAKALVARKFTAVAKLNERFDKALQKHAERVASSQASAASAASSASSAGTPVSAASSAGGWTGVSTMTGSAWNKRVGGYAQLYDQEQIAQKLKFGH